MKIFFISVIAMILAGCMSPGARYGHSKEPIALGGGQFLVEGYKLEFGLERAREFCGTKEMVSTQIMRPLDNWEWTKITFVCK